MDGSPNRLTGMDSRRGAARRDRLIKHWDQRAGRATADTWSASSRPWVCTRATGKVLDVCVGDGANLPFYPVGVTLTGVDFSPAMVQATRLAAKRAGRQIDARIADVEHLPFGDTTFDTVVATFAMCCVPDENIALAEMVRVLKPGGHLLLADTIASSNPVLRLLEHVTDLVTIPLEGHHQTRRPLPIVEALGLEVVDSEQDHHGLIERLDAVKP